MDLSQISRKPNNLQSQSAISCHRFWPYTVAWILTLSLLTGFTAQAEDVGVYGPEQFTRSTGKPVRCKKPLP